MTYFAYSYFKKSGHPKMYNRACRLMAEALRCLYSEDDLAILEKDIDAALSHDLPAGHAAHLVRHEVDDEVLCLYLATGRADDEVARLYFSAVKDAVGVSCYERPNLPARTRAK